MFSRIRDHETAAEKGPSPPSADPSEGIDEDGEAAEGAVADEEWQFAPMPSEEAILEAQGLAQAGSGGDELEGEWSVDEA